MTSKGMNAITAAAVALALLVTVGLMALASTPQAQSARGVSMGYERLFDREHLMQLNIVVDEEAWAELLENATAEEYISCDIELDGQKLSNVGIRAKGNSSLSQVASSDSDRYSFKLEFDHYVNGQTLLGLDKMVVNNMHGDASYLKEYMTYHMMQTLGVTTPLYAFARISVNGVYWGLYLAIEALEESFAGRNYGTSYGQLYKPDTMEMGGGRNQREDAGAEPPGQDGAPFAQTDKDGQAEQMPDQAQGGAADPFDASQGEGTQADAPGQPSQLDGGGFPGGRSGGGADLQYVDGDPDSYADIFDGAVFEATQSDYTRVVKALEHLSTGEDLESYIDVDQVLRYFAVNTFTVNLDSYVSSMKHNYYLYEEDGKLTMLPWDFNLAFGAFQSGSAQTAVNFPIDTPVSGTTLEERPMLGKLLEVEAYKQRYHSYLAQLVDTYFTGGLFNQTVDQLAALISDSVREDPTAFYTYEQFVPAVEMLKTYGQRRALSVQGQLDGTVPSTQQGQEAQPGALIDAQDIQMQVMGQQGGMGGGFSGRGQQTATATDLSGGAAGGDRDAMRKAMELLRANDGELSNDVRQQLLDLGMETDQIDSLSQMGQGMGQGGRRGLGRDGAQEAAPIVDTAAAWRTLAACAGLLALALAAAIGYRRKN